MKKVILHFGLVLSILFPSKLAFCQAGNVFTAAGGGTSTFDGVPATSADFTVTAGVSVDNAGNIYIADSAQNKVRKVDFSTGLIHTIAGTGVAGFSGDGGPASAAQLSYPQGVFVDNTGDIFIADAGNLRVRKVDGITGIITTVAGGGTSTLDGVPATSHQLYPLCVYVDASGNIYSGGNYKLYKVSAISGLITTVAGNGSGGDAGDGGLATAATLSFSIKSISMDQAGNLYVVSSTGSKVRRIDAMTNIITTVAGGGTSLAEGVLATNALLLGVHSCTADLMGNLFIAERSQNRIRRVNVLTGLINTIAGADTTLGAYMGEGVPAMNAFVDPYLICIDANNSYVYYSNQSDKVRRFSFLPMYGSPGSSVFDSMFVSIKHFCNGPELKINTPHFISGRSIRTYFGDGSSDSSVITSGYMGGGYTIIRHTYPHSGVYTIRQLLYQGAVVQDSMSYNYSYEFCRSLPVAIFSDSNGNGIRDASELLYGKPSLTQVDSNGIPIDTLSATSGFTYNAYCSPGDIYSFHMIPGVMAVTCPSGGIISDTIQAIVPTYPVEYFGLSCLTATNLDLSVNAIVPVTGIRDQWGDIYVANDGCLPVNATVKLYFSPKYIFSGNASPSPSSASGNSVTWNLAALSSSNAAPIDLYYVLINPATGYLTPGDTVQTHIEVTPTSGDINPANNTIIFVDTVKASCDPNFIKVTPNCITSGTLPTQLKYTIHFENTGNDTAHNIYVFDTLPAYVNASSLRMVMASHVMNIDIQSHDGYKVARFDFPNINLLDSSHHGECDGAFIYTINTNAGLIDGTDIMNRVGIYFDYNAVVMTNEEHNQIGGCWPTGVPEVKKDISATLYPNPFTDILHIDAAAATHFSITNIVGATLQRGELVKGDNQVNVTNLASGIYLITLTDKDGARSVHKVVKE
ncbi:hypothetical protein CJD36_009485 [Flavipsychrobacter stenotrophus]|uniref:Uncharacterized protein n=1 Tax=Flavipsychrobacter stenotrophus TaxID=2077091 RepID=A0A2S7SZH6_9BACT|nr:T9SS type A sorting domain-containing protein [Flavipsychrobacter stenotrophus]PQJ12011.1 hypothetical protein CJD36_009485 [Flavipsychrobacter stenotrophus]